MQKRNTVRSCVRWWEGMMKGTQLEAQLDDGSASCTLQSDPSFNKMHPCRKSAELPLPTAWPSINVVLHCVRQRAASPPASLLPLIRVWTTELLSLSEVDRWLLWLLYSTMNILLLVWRFRLTEVLVTGCFLEIHTTVVAQIGDRFDPENSILEQVLKPLATATHKQ